MQLNKVLKGLMIALPVMAIAACSSNKNASNDQSGEGMLGAGTGMDANGNGNMSSEEQARLQMQQLQQNNIVYFDLDKYDIRSDFAAMLDAHANFLRSNPSYKVTVEGHADERGTPEYNISLGERRANAVKMYLQGKGVSADQISIVSYGKEKPAVLGSVGSGSVEDRVTQLERISNAHSQLLTQLQQQLSDNQTDIDALRGQIQESQYQLNQVVDRQKQIMLQIDSLSSGGAQTQSASGDQSNTTAAPAPAGGNTAASGAPAQTGDANTDYNAAIALVKDSARQDDAIAAFQNFIKKYPDSTYQPNANYWLGQLNYNKGKKDDAAFYFASVVKNYPKSPKAADAMFKVGVIMQDKGDTAKAKAVYQQVVSKYPGTDGAKQAQKRLSGL